MTISREDAADLCMKAGYIRTNDIVFTAFIIRLITLVRAQAFEEAAKVCERDDLGAKHQGDVVAAAIRSMAK